MYSQANAHEYTHNIHFAYGTHVGNLDFFIEGFAEWAADIIMFGEGNVVPSFSYSNPSSPGEPLFPPRPFDYDNAKIFATYLADRIGSDNMKRLIQVCEPGGVCDVDDPDDGDWYQGIDGLDYALSSLDSSLTLSGIVVDYHTTNFVNDSSVVLDGVKHGYETPRYANKKMWPRNVVVVDFSDSAFSEKELELYPGGYGYVTYENPSNLHLSLDKSHSDVTSLRLFKERNNTKELLEMDGDVTEYTVAGDYDRVTLIAVHNNPRPNQPEITLNISATQNYDPTSIEEEELPGALSLAQNYPNPFNPSTFIRWAQPQTGQVRLSVYNMLGQEVATLIDEIRPAGTHETRLDALGWTSGVYVYVLEAGEQTLTQKMILLK
ncbi:MAG: T9SS type A sorting domain-containing protein [Bacteroidetes bacterium SB0668_bin_1]|nr:T9SS type A sorting domain-containing protein [Bacteroidetes bacterium SB0668_bin_1]